MFYGNQAFKTLLPGLPSLCFAKTAVGQQSPNATLQIYHFNMSISFRQHFCDCYTDVAEGHITLEDSIQGINLATCVVLGEYFQLNEDTGAIPSGYPGLMVVLMDEFCAQASCMWRDSFVVTTGPPEGKTFTKIAVWSIEMYDVSLQCWMFSVERMSKGVTFRQSWYDASIIMVAGKLGESSTFDPWAWLTPFHNSVWYMLLVTVFTTAAVYLLLEEMNHKSNKRQTLRGPIQTTYLDCHNLVFTIRI
jgi:hypothetical protein